MKYVKLFLCINMLFLFYSCNKKEPLFRAVDAAHSNVHFNNLIVETDSINPIDVTNIYNGGGVGIGDFNNDGLQDIYFTGNLVSNKLYLNQGQFVFKDITAEANAGGEGRWCRGVAVVDINNDGWLDMYVCVSMDKLSERRQNLLYVNQGKNKNGIPYFKEMAAAYGLNDTTHSTMAAFFDYDNDGDLDMYLVVNEILKTQNPGIFKPIVSDGSFPSTGRLYRNDFNKTLMHPVFTETSKKAGIAVEGYGHGVSIADFNKDGWKDIFVTNDFNSNDLLYINNHDGTFTDKAKSYFKHTSANGMGQDVIDINNDGLSDVIEVDMNPQDNYRKKMMLSANSYQNYQNSDIYGYQYQYVRNSLQINQGPGVNQNDSVGDPVFSDAGFFSGIAETDWSWTPLVQDFDNDGYRDIVITNGFPKDVTDHDFIAFRQQSYNVAGKEFTLSQIPQVKIHNYAFHNNGNTTFSNESFNWGLEKTSFSNGAAYADFDNDGDMDVVMNNIDDEAFIYENTSMNDSKKRNHYLSVKLAGDSLNLNGFGAWIEIYYSGKKQVIEQTPYRGYLSTDQSEPHFGLGNISLIDSLIVKWQDGKMQIIKNVAVDRSIVINKKEAADMYNWKLPLVAQNTLFKEVTDSLNVHFVHQQKDFIDFNIQKLLPHKLSEYGPGLAAGDIDGNGFDDLIAGGAASNSAQLFLQQPDSRFLQTTLLSAADASKKQAEDMGLILFDADNDGDLDLYISSGGYQSKSGTNNYRDKFYVNDGKGNYTADSLALPNNLSSKFCVRAVDYDKDGDLDLFVAGRVDPWNYPKPVSSFIYRNDSPNGHIKFTDVSGDVAKDLKNIGLVCDAIFSDFDNDGWPDMILAGEWMPITFLKNDKGIFKNVSATSDINNQVGWWNTIVPGDFDNDGDVDYIVGNLGQNSFYKASDQYPVSVYAKDFDNNGSYDAFPALYLPTSQLDQSKKEYPAQTRDDIIKQMIGMRSKFQNYKSYAAATIDQLLTKEQLQGAVILRANNLKSCFVKNDGNNKFSLTPLPAQAQLSVLNGMLADDFDGDGNVDVLINGNDYGTEVSVGRYDALNGLLLKGSGDGNFTAQTILESGIYIPGNGKALVKLRSGDNKYLVAASQNRGRLKIFELKKKNKFISLLPDDISAVIKLKNGKIQKQEFYYGTSFLSQSARLLNVTDSMASATIYNTKGQSRTTIF
jgi:hypothetical protein